MFDVDVDVDVDVAVDVDFEVDVDIDVAAKKEWNIKMPASGVEMGANYLSGASGTGICEYCNQCGHRASKKDITGQTF